MVVSSPCSPGAEDGNRGIAKADRPARAAQQEAEEEDKQYMCCNLFRNLLHQLPCPLVVRNKVMQHPFSPHLSASRNTLTQEP